MRVVPSGVWQVACDIDQDYTIPQPDPNLAVVKHIHVQNSIPAYDYLSNSTTEPLQYVSTFRI